jgi:hypothetical protein
MKLADLKETFDDDVARTSDQLWDAYYHVAARLYQVKKQLVRVRDQLFVVCKNNKLRCGVCVPSNQFFMEHNTGGVVHIERQDRAIIGRHGTERFPLLTHTIDIGAIDPDRLSQAAIKRSRDWAVLFHGDQDEEEIPLGLLFPSEFNVFGAQRRTKMYVQDDRLVRPLINQLSRIYNAYNESISDYNTIVAQIEKAVR